MQKEQDKNMKNRKKLVGFEWDNYLGNKGMKYLSFFTIAKSKVKNIVSVGVCK
jgi:hypothetical protein